MMMLLLEGSPLLFIIHIFLLVLGIWVAITSSAVVVMMLIIILPKIFLAKVTIMRVVMTFITRTLFTILVFTGTNVISSITFHTKNMTDPINPTILLVMLLTHNAAAITNRRRLIQTGAPVLRGGHRILMLILMMGTNGTKLRRCF